MPRNFATIAFTPSVKATQTRYGTRAANEGFERDPRRGDTLGPAEAQFIEARDGFYQATVSEKDGDRGWPYVQFRGGPAGFLKVLDEKTIGYADFRGNVQYLSVGNLASNDRIALILMDYANRRRLKLWARARVVHEDEDPELLARLEIPTYRARVERAIILTIEAIEWNCPQHITPRFTETEIADYVAPLKRRIAALEAAASPGISSPDNPVIGIGPLELVVTGIRQLTPDVRAYELRRPDLTDLPVIEAGVHIDLPVPDAAGGDQTRSFSISSDPARHDAWQIAVRREAEGTGGTRAIHAQYSLGLHIRTSQPRNGFPLHEDDRPAVLIAGGIGITPMKSMAQSLSAAGRRFHLHYGGRSRNDMAYHGELQKTLGDNLTLYAGDAGRRIDVAGILSHAPEDAVFYVCGPNRLIDAVRDAASAQGIAPVRIRFERFSVAMPEAGDVAFDLHLVKSDRTIPVAAHETMLDALLDAGVEASYGCRSGACGTCAVNLLGGSPIHRDEVLTDAEREKAGVIFPCVSRATAEGVTLDL